MLPYLRCVIAFLKAKNQHQTKGTSKNIALQYF